MLVGIGGVLLERKPVALLRRLVEQGARDLDLASFLASYDVEWLVRQGVVRSVRYGYVGFERHGFAPAWQEAVETGRVDAIELSETMFVGGLRASGAGLPFFPVRGPVGSDLAADLATVSCPYTGQPVMVVPALRPDVALIHAAAADEAGNVLTAPDPGFLPDADVILARASAQVVVSVERIVDRAEVLANNERTVLFAHEVDEVVVAPGGAAPTGLAGEYDVDHAHIRAWLAAS